MSKPVIIVKRGLATYIALSDYDCGYITLVELDPYGAVVASLRIPHSLFTGILFGQENADREEAGK